MEVQLQPIHQSIPQYHICRILKRTRVTNRCPTVCQVLDLSSSGELDLLVLPYTPLPWSQLGRHGDVQVSLSLSGSSHQYIFAQRRRLGFLESACQYVFNAEA